MKKDLVVKDNALINASYNLDLVEQRLILLAILEARESNTPTNKDLTIHVDSYINHFNVHRNTAYQALQDASRNLFERRFSYQKLTPKGNIENVTSRWVQRVSYVENEALVRIRFSDDVEPLITNLEKHFTSYELEQVSNLTSVYAIRLYELLIAWRSTGKVAMIGLDELRSKLGIEPHEYKRMGQFKEKVLHLAIEQINDHTDIKADYEQHKKGRSIVGFSFSFKQKTKPKPVKQQRDPDTLDMFCDMSDAQIKTYSSILSKVQSISDLAGNKDYSAFAVWIGNVLRDPASVREETAKRVFKALRTETDFKG
ncbi:RepB family plasmid replication initiator protein [Acinetobacter pittii]|uniref:replication initiation protein RepM n=2 Tax=Acinetobacter pittii TaxID=48296 RepID=UPI0008394EC9|nr:replication initiation protein RepM [Acinetobacter pittii]OCY31787.1 RepB family plasmid replication initiator protein [Acinetobacter pittii]